MFNQKKKLVVPLAILNLVIILFLIFRTRVPSITMYQSSITANNIQLLHMQDDTLRFFTGSNLSTLTIDTKVSTQKPARITPMEPLNQTEWTPEGLLVQVNSLSEDGYLINLVPESDRSLYLSKPSWWLVTDSGVRLFSVAGFNSTEISDVLFYKNTYYIAYGDSSSQLYGIAKYTVGSTEESLQKTNQLYSQPSLIGIVQDTLYFKDSRGTLFTFANGVVSSLDLIVSTAQWDEASNSMVVSQASRTKNSQGEEGHNSPKEYSIGILGSDAKITKLFATKTGKYSVYNGRVLAPITDSKSKKLFSYDIKTTKLVQINLEGTAIDTSSIVTLLPYKDFILAIDRENNLSIIGSDRSKVASFSEAVLVKTEEKTTSTDWFLIDYDFTTNRADVVVYDTDALSAPQTIISHYNELEQILGDPNQVKLSWSFAGPAD